MKLKFLLLGLLTLPFVSCIKDEALFREADIEKFSLSEDYMVSSVIQSKLNRVTIMVYDTTGFYNKTITPTIEISTGATVFPASDTPITLEDYGAFYTVKPEDGDNGKTYFVNIVPFIPLKFDFEEWTKVSYMGGRKIYFELNDPFWACPNSTMAIMYHFGIPFPTRYSEDSYSGDKALLLETIKGRKNVAKLFPGSMFRGQFQFNGNMNDPIPSARFGQLHPEYVGKPILFTGWYKYKPGDDFQNTNEEIVLGKVDELDIYSVLFKVTKGPSGQDEYLIASDLIDIHSSGKVVAMAMITDRTPKDEYTRFEIPFIYFEKLNYAANDYKLAIVFSSSKGGAFFEGAVGSMLWIDEVEIKCQSLLN